MHATDAIQGDLGPIPQVDIVNPISKSGNKLKIKVLAPLLERRGSKFVFMIGNTGHGRNAKWALSD